MSDSSSTNPQPPPTIPPDDPRRELRHLRPDDAGGQLHISVAGDTYTILLTGEDTAGRFTLIDMHVPPGGGPPPHRHDFEETFSVLEGEIEVMFRGATSIVRAGETVNVPANAPHAFRNASGQQARMLCTCSPSGRSSSRRSATRSRAARRHRPSLTRPPSARDAPERKNSHRITARSCSSPLGPHRLSQLGTLGPSARARSRPATAGR